MADLTIDEQAENVAQRFHAHHEKLHATAKGHEPTDWDGMPESYRRRLRSTFAFMLRDGSIQAGALLRMHSDARPAIF